MAKYVEQWDLPCYPHTKPSRNCRTTCGIGSGRFMDAKASGYYVMIGGTGEHRAPTVAIAREVLMREVERRLNEKINLAQAELMYYQDLLAQFSKFPFKFQVEPDA